MHTVVRRLAAPGHGHARGGKKGQGRGPCAHLRAATSVGRSISRRSPSAVRMSPSPPPLVDAPAVMWWGKWYSLGGRRGAKSRRSRDGERGRLIYSHPFFHERHQRRTRDWHAPSAGGPIARLMAHVHAHLCAPKRRCAGASWPKRRRPQPTAAGELAARPGPRASAPAPSRRARPIGAAGTMAEGPSGQPALRRLFDLLEASWRESELSSSANGFSLSSRFSG